MNAWSGSALSTAVDFIDLNGSVVYTSIRSN